LISNYYKVEGAQALRLSTIFEIDDQQHLGEDRVEIFKKYSLFFIKLIFEVLNEIYPTALILIQPPPEGSKKMYYFYKSFPFFHCIVIVFIVYFLKMPFDGYESFFWVGKIIYLIEKMLFAILFYSDVYIENRTKNTNVTSLPQNSFEVMVGRR
jgi:hypothetical protein